MEALQQHAGRQEATLVMGVGKLVDADLTNEAAQLEAARVRGQLALQTISIVDGAPGWMMTLFKR